MKPDIVFLSESNSDVGAGHVIRCIELAKIFLRNQFKCKLLLDPTNISWLEAYLDQTQIERVSLESIHELKFQNSILIYDFYSENLENLVNNYNWKLKILISDDFTPKFKADFIFYQSLTKHETNINSFSGSKFLILKKIDGHLGYLNDKSKRQLKNVIFFSGGGQGMILNQNCQKLVSEFKQDISFKVVGKSELIRNNYRKSFEIIDPKYDLSSYILEADLVISPASTTALECIAAGKIVGTFKFVANQSISYKNLTTQQLAFPLSDSDFDIDVTKLNKFLTADIFELRQNLKTSGIDFNGAERVYLKIIDALANFE